MRKYNEHEMERRRVTKIMRTVIRLKHSLAADEELNARLPDTLDEFDAALARGELKQLDLTAAVGDVNAADA